MKRIKRQQQSAVSRKKNAANHGGGLK